MGGVVAALRNMSESQLKELVETTVEFTCSHWGGLPAGQFFREFQSKLREGAVQAARGGQTRLGKQGTDEENAEITLSAGDSPTLQVQQSAVSLKATLSEMGSKDDCNWTQGESAVILKQKR